MFFKSIHIWRYLSWDFKYEMYFGGTSKNWITTFSFFFFFLLFLFILLQLSHFPPFVLLHPAHLRSHSPSPHHCPGPWVIHTCSLTSPFPFFPPLPSSALPSGHCQSAPCFYASGSILLISFCSLGSSYMVDHMVFVFHHLAYFT